MRGWVYSFLLALVVTIVAFIILSFFFYTGCRFNYDFNYDCYIFGIFNSRTFL